MTPKQKDDPLAAADAVLGGLQAIAQATRAALAKATTQLKASSDDLASKQAAAEADPTVANLSEVHRAETALRVAQRNHAKAATEDARASGEATAAEQRLGQMRIEAKTSAELAALRVVASQERFNVEAASLSAELYSHLIQARAKAHALDTLRSSVNEASAELRTRDEHVSDIDEVHLVAGLLRAHVDADPRKLQGVIRAYNPIRWALAGGLEPALFAHIDKFLDGEQGSHTTPDQVAGDRAELEALLGARTQPEALEKLREAQRRRKKAPADAAATIEAEADAKRRRERRSIEGVAVAKPDPVVTEPPAGYRQGTPPEGSGNPFRAGRS